MTVPASDLEQSKVDAPDDIENRHRRRPIERKRKIQSRRRRAIAESPTRMKLWKQSPRTEAGKELLIMLDSTGNEGNQLQEGRIKSPRITSPKKYGALPSITASPILRDMEKAVRARFSLKELDDDDDVLFPIMEPENHRSAFRRPIPSLKKHAGLSPQKFPHTKFENNDDKSVISGNDPESPSSRLRRKPTSPKSHFGWSPEKLPALPRINSHIEVREKSPIKSPALGSLSPKSKHRCVMKTIKNLIPADSPTRKNVNVMWVASKLVSKARRIKKSAGSKKMFEADAFRKYLVEHYGTLTHAWKSIFVTTSTSSGKQFREVTKKLFTKALRSNLPGWGKYNDAVLGILWEVLTAEKEPIPKLPGSRIIPQESNNSNSNNNEEKNNPPKNSVTTSRASSSSANGQRCSLSRRQFAGILRPTIDGTWSTLDCRRKVLQHHPNLESAFRELKDNIPDRKIGVKEFIQGMEAFGVPEEGAFHYFRIMDENNDGRITQTEFMKTLTTNLDPKALLRDFVKKFNIRDAKGFLPWNSPGEMRRYLPRINMNEGEGTALWKILSPQDTPVSVSSLMNVVREASDMCTTFAEYAKRAIDVEIDLFGAGNKPYEALFRICGLRDKREVFSFEHFDKLSMNSNVSRADSLTIFKFLEDGGPGILRVDQFLDLLRDAAPGVDIRRQLAPWRSKMRELKREFEIAPLSPVKPRQNVRRTRLNLRGSARYNAAHIKLTEGNGEKETDRKADDITQVIKVT